MAFYLTKNLYHRLKYYYKSALIILLYISRLITLLMSLHNGDGCINGIY